MKKLYFLFFVAMLLFLAACGDEEAKIVEEDSQQADAAPEEEKEETEDTSEETTENTVFSVGDTVELNDAQLTLTSASFVDAEDYAPSEKGAILAVGFEAVNNGEESLYIGSEELAISTPDGTQHKEYYGKDDGFMNENISAGKKITGTIYYDVPEESSYEIVYEPTFTFNSETAVFEIIPQ